MNSATEIFAKRVLAPPAGWFAFPSERGPRCRRLTKKHEPRPSNLKFLGQNSRNYLNVSHNIGFRPYRYWARLRAGRLACGDLRVQQPKRLGLGRRRRRGEVELALFRSLGRDPVHRQLSQMLEQPSEVVDVQAGPGPLRRRFPPGASETAAPRSTAQICSTASSGSFVMLAMVRFRTFPPSRQDSRIRIVGGEPRFGTVSISMSIRISCKSPL